MWKLVFLTLLLNQLMPLAKSENILPSMVKIIKMHFREREGTNLFFCQKIGNAYFYVRILNWNLLHWPNCFLKKRVKMIFINFFIFI